MRQVGNRGYKKKKKWGRDFKIHAADCTVGEVGGIKNMGME